MAGFRDGLTSIDFLHQISSRIAAADPLHVVLASIVEFVTTVIPCDSCFIYVLEQGKLVLRASKNPHADLVDHLGFNWGRESPDGLRKTVSLLPLRRTPPTTLAS